ncbi:zinc finger BED domain-containing protein RICESLEEPER 2-like protein [Tanacetum coccineum]
MLEAVADQRLWIWHAYFGVPGANNDPEWSTFVKTFSVTRDVKTFKFKTVQEAARKDIERAFGVAAKQVIINDFLNLNASVNITTDVWSAPHGLPGSYICVTAHWIEPSTWQTMKRVIAFENFSVPHTGNALAKMLRNAFVNFNMEDASNNTKAIGKRG